MIGALLFNLIAVFFAWMESARVFKHGLKFSLLTVFLFLSLRYDFGNDYLGYLGNYLNINSNENLTIDFFSIKGNEIGWFYLNRIFASLGFFTMTAVLAAFTCFVLYRFIKKYVPPQYYWFSVFLYMFQPYNMLVLSSAMRQAVAVALFLFAIDFIIQKSILKYFLIIIIATLFHTSAIFLFPFILLGFINWKINIIHILIIIIVIAIPIIYSVQIYSNMDIIVNQYFNYYTSYTKDVQVETKLGFGFLLNMVIYYLTLYYSLNDINRTNNIFYKIAIIALFVMFISFTINLISRLNFYLVPVMMAVFPIVFLRIKKTIMRSGLIGVIVLFTIYQFFMFFQSEVWKIAFGKYQTIFSAPQFY